MQASEAELRDLVRSLVVAALQRLPEVASASGVASSAAPVPSTSAASGHRLLIVFMSREPVPDEFFSQINALSAQGYQFTAAFSRSFEQTHPMDEIAARFPAGTPRFSSSSTEQEVLTAAARCSAVLAPTLSPSTSAKVSMGIEDSIPSLLLRDALLVGRPVFIARDLPLLERELAERYPAAAPSLLRISVDAVHRLQAAGVRFVPAARLSGELASTFHQPVNETPARLASTKPAPRRVFITAEDVYTAASAGQTELRHPTEAVITDAARDEAAARGVTLVSHA